jgi:aromatic-L-amino-acid decarboxylase
MLEKIKTLEAEARKLEPDATARAEHRNKVLDYTEDFLNRIHELKAYNVTETKGAGIYDSPISETPTSIDTLIDLVEKQVDFPGLNPASGGHLGYIPGGGIYYSALGDYMADVTNRYAGVYFASPGAVRMENMLIDWMAEMIGYSGKYAGNLTSGGSMANLIGIVTARDAHQIKGKDLEQTVIYASRHMHHCLNKAIRIAGLQECILRHIPLDEGYRLRPEVLKSTIEEDVQNGLRPFLVIASAGTTDVGAVDPLNEVANIAEEHNLWFHVDGAYGAFFMLSEMMRPQLKGIERADSVVMDPHKGLFLPYGSGVILVKDREKMYNAHYYQANYMQDTLAEQDELSPADLSPELTKHFRGLRMWLPLKLHGLTPFRACVEEKVWLTRYFYEEIQKIDGFEVGPYPELSVATFRYIPKEGDANTFNEKLVNLVKKDGRVFLSSTQLEGKFIIRLAVLSFRAHQQIIDLTLQVLKEKVEELLATEKV